MPLYFFDTDDGRTFVRDEEGCEVRDEEASRRLALEALTDIARDCLPAGEHRTWKIDVRDATGERIYHAEIGLTGKWQVPREPKLLEG